MTAMRRLFGATTLALLVLTSGSFAAMTPKQIVTTVDVFARSFSCQAKQGEPSWTYRTTDKTRIRVKGQRVRVSHLWHRGKFSDIKAGNVVSIRYHLDGSERIAERVIVYPAR
jgi:hypothetical protein